MSELGNLGGSWIGPRTGNASNVISSSVTTYTSLNTADRGWAWRFIATDTKDIKTVYVNFSSVSSPGTITARIETIDATTGKPTGTLYDASASVGITPTTGWNAFTFASLPTAGLVAGTSYAIVLISGGGTTCTLNSHVGGDMGTYPQCVLTCPSASAATRSNFAEVTGNVAAICYAIMEDNQVYGLGGCSSILASTADIFGADTVIAQKIVLPVDVVIRGISSNASLGMIKNGTPAGDLRVRILNSSNTAIVTVTLDKDELSNVSARGLYIPLPLTTLVAGTYRIALDSASSANSSNCFSIRYVTINDAKLQSSSFCYSSSANASTTFTWTDTTTRQLNLGFIVDSITAGSTNVVDPMSLNIPGV